MQLQISASGKITTITKKLRVVFLARNTSPGPPLHPYQILSNCLKQYGTYGLHKITASGEITT